MLEIKLAKGKYNIPDEVLNNPYTRFRYGNDELSVELRKKPFFSYGILNRLKKIYELQSSHLPVYDYGEYKGEYVTLIKSFQSSCTLKEFYKEKMTSYYQKYDLLKQVVAAVNIMHSHGVIHGSICAENIMVTSSTYTNMLYFRNVNDLNQNYDSRKDYIAPELKRKSKKTQEGDLYALGRLLCKMITHFNPTIGNEVECLDRLVKESDDNMHTRLLCDRDAFSKIRVMVEEKKRKREVDLEDVYVALDALQDLNIEHMEKSKISSINLRKNNNYSLATIMYGIIDHSLSKTTICELNRENNNKKIIGKMNSKLIDFQLYKNDLYYVRKQASGIGDIVYRLKKEGTPVGVYKEKYGIKMINIDQNNICYIGKKNDFNKVRDCIACYDMSKKFSAVYRFENGPINGFYTMGRYIVYSGSFNGGWFGSSKEGENYPVHLFDIVEGEIHNVTFEKYPITTITAHKDNIYYATKRNFEGQEQNAIIKVNLGDQEKKVLYTSNNLITSLIAEDKDMVIAESNKEGTSLIGYSEDTGEVVYENIKGKIIGLKKKSDQL